MANDRPHIAPVPAKDTELMLRKTPNGGWIVTCGNDARAIPGMIPNCVGAFTNAKDMLIALEDALIVPEMDFTDVVKTR